VITYAAINLTNKKFQVGSTTDFARRCREHHDGKGDLEFQRSLRKNPENFYWIVSQNDGLESRDEEQYYLDFYHGSVWCYNHNPSASAPPSPKGRTWGWSEEKKQGITGSGNHRYGKGQSPLQVRRLQEVLRGGTHPMATPIMLIHPDGSEEYFDYLSGACEKNNLQQSNLRKVALGERKQHKGFSARFI
jgi:hypothetical protein